MSIIEQLHQPLLDVKLPTVNDLYHRCTENEATQLLDAASLLASYRCESAKHVQNELDIYQHPPFNKKVNLDLENDTALLLPIDLVRALVAQQPEFIRDCLFGAELESNSYLKDPSPLFWESSKYWGKLLGEYRSENLPDTLEGRWARRWALELLKGQKLEIDVSTLACAVLEWIPPEWTDIYDQGLVTKAEVNNQIISNVLNYYEDSQTHPTILATWIPATCYDHAGVIQSLNTSLKDNPVAMFVVGDDYSRNMILDALDPKLSHFSAFNWINETRIIGDSYVLNTKLTQYFNHITDENVIFLFAGNLSIQSSPGWSFDLQNPIVSPAAEMALSFFRNIATSGTEDSKKIILILNQKEFNELTEILPKISDFPKIEVPSLTTRELIPLLLAKLPKLEIDPKFNLTVGEFLNALFNLDKVFSIDIPEDLDGLLEQLIDYVRMSRSSKVRTDYLDFYTRGSTQTTNKSISTFSLTNSGPFSILSRTLKPRNPIVTKMLDQSFPFFDKYIGSLKNLEEFIYTFNIIQTLSTSELPEVKLKQFDEIVLKHQENNEPTVIRSLFKEPISSTTELFQQNKHPENEIKNQNAYIDAVKDLPDTDNEHATRFAIDISHAHSWYKHLAVIPIAHVYLCLNPYAGMRKNTDSDSEKKFKEVSDNDTGLNFKRTTKDYRKLFGYWDYYVDHGYRFLEPSLCMTPEGYVNENNFSIKNEISVSPQILNSSKVNISAFLSSEISFYIWYDSREFLIDKGFLGFLSDENKLPETLDPSLRFLSSIVSSNEWYQDNDLLIDDPIFSSLMDQNVNILAYDDHQTALEEALKLGGRKHYSGIRLLFDHNRYKQQFEKSIISTQRIYLDYHLISNEIFDATTQHLEANWENPDLFEKSLNDMITRIRTKILSEQHSDSMLTHLNPSTDFLDSLISDRLMSHFRTSSINSGSRSLFRDIKKKLEAQRQSPDPILCDFSFSPILSELINKTARIHTQQLENMIQVMQGFKSNL